MVESNNLAAAKRLACLLLFIILSSCGKKAADPQAELARLKQERAELDKKIAALEAKAGPRDSSKVVQVGALTIEPSTFTTYIEVQGFLDADENVVANAEAPGVVTAILTRTGNHVRKGQVLVRLDNKALQQQISSAQTQLDLATSLFNRQKNLWDQKIGSEIQFIQARSNMEVAQKQLAALKAQGSMYTIKSPIDGVVDQMDLKVGQVIQPGMQGIRIVNLDKLKAKASIAESYVGQVHQGDQVLVILPDAGDSVQTTLTYAAKVIDPSSRSFNVEVRLPASKNLKPNMTAVLRIVDYQKANAIVVPVKAIQKSESGDYVYIADKQHARRIAVKTGDTYGGRTEILSGIGPGKQLIVEGAQDVEEGDRVNVVNAS